MLVLNDGDHRARGVEPVGQEEKGEADEVRKPRQQGWQGRDRTNLDDEDAQSPELGRGANRESLELTGGACAASEQR